MKIDLSGKTALITGGNVGIGKGIALTLAESGADVAFTYLSHNDNDTLEKIQNFGRKAVALKLDATNSGEVNEVVSKAAAELGGHIDILINNAGGLVARVPVAEMTDEYWHKVMNLNLSSTFYVTRAVIPFMNQGWGRIVNMSSLASQNGGSNGAIAYATSKGAINTFTRGLAKELAPLGITVNAVAPGLILETPFHDTFTPKAAQQATIDSLPLKRAGVPADVAGVVLYYVSELSSFVTGDIADINGGAWFT
jgi:3-oxoacyl-[acyl-carrier protein] reductase